MTHDGARPRRKPGPALLSLIAGAALVTSFGVVSCQDRTPADFGTPPVAAPVSTEPEPAQVRIHDGRTPATAATDKPVRLTIPALRVAVPVTPVGIDSSTGDLAIPENVNTVGWYRFGPDFSATTGSIVIAGHVDSADAGKGALFRLDTLRAADTVTLTGADGHTRTFRVTARERYRKTAIPLDKYFSRDGSVRLTLITCGGPFDSRTRHYRDNVVVTAVPA
ncbi:class F sortase [Winogradskya humida]|uniref:Class F sortase n=1 Tax=Winogradskya humida TaxID=113566 RepID=A0ABQ4A5K9_9ACTN|nr:class F sortase [Actinoplanes humidus]GIE26004.1 class F sortase [Actinoplanes humidus]